MNTDVIRIANLPYDWDRFRNKTILMSGGTGLIGSFLCNVFRYRNDQFGDNVSIVSLSRHPKSSDKTVTYRFADLNHHIDVGTIKPSYVMHLASNTHPAAYKSDPVGTIMTNISGCAGLLEIARKCKSERFLLASSVEIYGKGAGTPMDELFSGYLNPNIARNGYNEAKRVCESLCQSYLVQFGVDVVIARLARVFGPDEKKDSKALAQFMEMALNDEKVCLKSKGEQRFSFCCVADAASGILKILLDGEVGAAYNIADDDEGLSLGDYARLIASFAGKECSTSIQQDLFASQTENALLDTSRLKKLGWSPCFTVTQALKSTFDEMRSLQTLVSK